MSPINTFYDQILATSIWEWLAVLTGVLYVIFAARKMIICWLFALISSALYIYICIKFNLYIESGLQFFYLVMAVVGWVAWNKKPKKIDKTDLLDTMEGKAVNADLKNWPIEKHALNIIASGITAFVLGFIFSRFTDQANPYMDAFTTVYSLAATFMVTQKVVENWIYWIIIDIVSIYLYAGRGLHLSAVLFAIFTILAVFGYIAWRKQFKAQLG